MPRILLVDDDDALRSMLHATLEIMGHEVVEARDGREALHLFQAEPPEVVLLDLIMPHQEGLETIVELRRLDPGVKIIAISGGGMGRAESYLKIARRIGAVSTLRKPFSNAAIVEAIAAAVGKK